MAKRITGIARTVTSPKPAEYVPTDHATDGSGKLDIADYVARHSGARAIRECCISDGATSLRSIYWPLGTAGAVATLPVSIPFDFDCPTSNPSADGDPAQIGSSASGTNTNSLRVILSAVGALQIQQTGAAGIADRRLLTYAGFRAAYSGQRVRGMVVFASPDTTTAPVIYINGIDVSASFTLGTSGTPPNWMPSTLSTTYYVNAASIAAIRFHPLALIFGALTAAEVLEWTQTGRLPTWCELATGSAVEKWVAGDAGSFGAGDANSTAYPVQSFHATLAATAGARTGGAGAYYLSATKTGNDWNTWKEQSLTVIAGQIYRYSFWAKVSTGTPSIRFALKNGGTDYSTKPSHVLSTSWQQFTGTVTVSVTGTVNRINFDCAGQGTNGDIYDIDDVELRLLGPTYKSVIQPILVIADTGSNKIAGILTTGMTPITEKRDWVIQAMTNTSGNQQLLGASVFTDSTRHVIDDWCMNTAGTPTVSAGSASAGTQYKASGALAAVRNLITLVTRVVASANFWVNANSTAEIRHTITGHIVD
jgi:hypothetical protein